MSRSTPILTADEAVCLIPDGATVAIGGFVGAGHPELLSAAVEQAFLREGRPKNLTLVYAAGQGDREGRGLNHFGHEGLVKRVIGGHWNLAPKLGKLALENRIEAYNLPQGVICQLFREIAAKRPGVFTKIGLNTFIDPSQTGGFLNPRTTEPLVERLTIDGEDWLRYRSFPIRVGLIRATAADRRGNLSFEGEALLGEALPIAQAARNHGGVTIAQVERLVDRIADPKAVRVPGILVDAVVVSDGVGHEQSFGETFNEAYVTSQHPGQTIATAANDPLPLERRLIAARALREIRPGDIVNLGIGLPEGVAIVAAETGRFGEFTLTVESGPIGGIPASGLSFGCSAWPESVIDQPAQFDYYDGGGIDIAILGAVEIDAEGSVNVSHISGRFAGVGGFVNISQSARRVVFCCPFLAGGLEIAETGGLLSIVREGRHRKFVRRVEHAAFHGPSATARGQEVIYVTERAVFRLRKTGGLELIEVAPGIDIRSQVLDQMEFAPAIAGP